MNKVIHKKLRLECRPQRAFEYFTVNRHITRWLAPRADVVPEVGGKYHLFWKMDKDVTESSEGCRITAIEHGKFLSFEWKSFEQFAEFMDDADPKTHCVVLFIPSPVDDTATDVHLIHSGWRENEQWEEARLWYDEAWNRSFATLQETVNG